MQNRRTIESSNYRYAPVNSHLLFMETIINALFEIFSDHNFGACTNVFLYMIVSLWDDVFRTIMTPEWLLFLTSRSNLNKASCPTRNFRLFWQWNNMFGPQFFWHTIFGAWFYHHEKICCIHHRSQYNVYLFGDFRPTREFFTNMETSPLPVKAANFDLWPLSS